MSATLVEPPQFKVDSSVQAEMIEGLRELLARAERGEITTFAYGLVDSTHSLEAHVWSDDTTDVQAAVRHLDKAADDLDD